MNKDISLNDIAGYATERTVWQMIRSLSTCPTGTLNGSSPHKIIIVGNGFILKEGAKDEMAFAAPERFGRGNEAKPEQADIWALGALAFYAITGTNVFEGKGGSTQTEETEVPRISSTHASKELSSLIRQCLSYSPKDRPQKEDMRKIAQNVLAAPAVPHKKLTSQAGKTYTNSLIKFWPEEMVAFVLICLLFFSPVNMRAQSQSGFDKSAIPNEMASLVLRCIDLRSSQNADKVSKAMDRDMNWTMMDELPLDKNGECKTTDNVDLFGLNDIGFRILKRHGGATNSGGRFRDGRDPRYKFSFIEITVKKGATVNYKISGREGEQMFAVVPFEKDAKFEATIPKGKSFTDNGVCYIQLKQGITKNDSFTLTLKNNSSRNMAFVLINYNSRNHE